MIQTERKRFRRHARTAPGGARTPEGETIDPDIAMGGQASLPVELRNAFSLGVPEPEYAADMADPEDVPESLAFSVVARARERSTELLAERLRQAAEAVGEVQPRTTKAPVSQEEDEG